MMRIIKLCVMGLMLSGCSAMMLGGDSSGGYQPPKDECAGKEQSNEGCKSD